MFLRILRNNLNISKLKQVTAFSILLCLFHPAVADSSESGEELTNAYIQAIRNQQDTQLLEHWLTVLVDKNWNQGFETIDFSGSVKTKETKRLLELLSSRVAPVNKSKLYRTIKIPELIPESIAVHGNRFFIGSLNQGRVFEITKGKVEVFIEGNLPVYGIKINDNKLWVLSNNRTNESRLKVYDLDSAKLLSSYTVSKPSELNDLVIIDDVAYVTDTRNSRILKTTESGKSLVTFYKSEELKYANGITSYNGKLFVASLKGIVEIALTNNSIRILEGPVGQSLAGIDGLYFHNHSLIAIQNAVGQSRVIKMGNLEGSLSVEVLEAANSMFEIPTTGLIQNSTFLFISNSQLAKLNTSLTPSLNTYILNIKL